MAVWYLNYGNGTNTGYYAVAQWALNHVYAAGDIVRQLATPTVGQERCFRTAAGGTSGGSEPAWTLTKGGTTTDNTVTWTEVTGNSTYNWNAPFARLATAVSSSWSAAGDTIYVAGQHAETQASALTATSAGTVASPQKIICVNQAGSVPPVSADLQTTATVTNTTGTMTLNGSFYVYGVTFYNNVAGNEIDWMTTGGVAVQYYKNCVLRVAGSSASIQTQTTGAQIVFDGTTVNFGSTGGSIGLRPCSFIWKNTANAMAGSAPSNLFTTAGIGYSGIVTLDGVDLSAITGNIFNQVADGGSFNIINCKLNASSTICATPTVVSRAVNLQISDSGTKQYRQEMYRYSGTLTTETTFIRSGGASDGTTPISWKVVSTANASAINPFPCFQIAIWNNTTGVSKTATIEIENGGVTLTNAQVWVDVEYLGSSATPISSVVSSGLADPLATAANIPTSSVTWNGGLGSAVKQYLQVTFTPQMVGYVRATVYVGVASQTLYIDPLITIA